MKNISKEEKEKGFIAMTSVLIIGALIVVLGVSIFHSSLTDQSMSSSYEAGQEALSLAKACVREGILRLKEDIGFAGFSFIEGREGIMIGQKVCNLIQVENISLNTKRISALIRSGERAHFKDYQQELRFSVESTASDWNRHDALVGLIIEGNSLALQPVFVTGPAGERIFQPTSGHRISSNLDISGRGRVKNSQIFWNADIRTDNNIVVATNVHRGGLPLGWVEVRNGGPIPGLERGVDLSNISIRTRVNFNGGPVFYPRLNNINIFIEI